MDPDLGTAFINVIRADASNAAEPLMPPQSRFSAETIASLFSPWETARGIVLCVSGGPDSVALMLLAAQWTEGLSVRPPLFVATVDHGLREESRKEAETVAGWAGALGLPQRILTWEGDKPRAKIQEKAREARYGLLFKYATEIGADLVMTAHHADDQAETVLFRLLRGSGVTGLAGMRRSQERDGLSLARPLLAYGKDDLVAVCKERGHPFISDPSNDDPIYARTRMRRLCALLAKEGLDRAALLRLALRAARADTALDARVEAVAASLIAQRKPGEFRADISALANEPSEILLRILAGELKVIGGVQRLRLERLEALVVRFQQALRSGTPLKATLGGTLLKLQRNHTLIMVREAPRKRHRENAPNVPEKRSKGKK
jgi:tRNA(Ile)-lysidine synthase